MKQAFLVLCAGLVLSIGAAAQDVMAPIHQLINGFNSNDDKAVAASYASGDILIVDEVAPFRWYGPNANAEWSADLEKHDKSEGVTDDKVILGTGARTEISGNTAYVVVPVSYTFKEKGKPMTESAHMTFVLHKEGSAWKISGWVWSGNKPRAAK